MHAWRNVCFYCTSTRFQVPFLRCSRNLIIISGVLVEKQILICVQKSWLKWQNSGHLRLWRWSEIMIMVIVHIFTRTLAKKCSFATILPQICSHRSVSIDAISGSVISVISTTFCSLSTSANTHTHTHTHTGWDAIILGLVQTFLEGLWVWERSSWSSLTPGAISSLPSALHMLATLR